MNSKLLKNVLQTIIYYIDADKHIDIQNDKSNDLDLFLTEFNRYRSMVGLNTYEEEKRMWGKGDYQGKIRYTPSSQIWQKPVMNSEFTHAPVDLTCTTAWTVIVDALAKAKVSWDERSYIANCIIAALQQAEPPFNIKDVSLPQEPTVETYVTIVSNEPQSNDKKQKITKIKFTKYLIDIYGDLKIKTEKQNNNAVTLFLFDNQVVGSWSKGYGKIENLTKHSS